MPDIRRAVTFAALSLVGLLATAPLASAHEEERRGTHRLLHQELGKEHGRLHEDLGAEYGAGHRDLEREHDREHELPITKKQGCISGTERVLSRNGGL